MDVEVLPKMGQHRLLVYSDAHELGATMQIRIATPLRECGYEIVHAATAGHETSQLRRLLQSEVDGVVVHRAIRKRCRRYDTILEAARAFGRPVIHDTDDLLFLVSQDHPHYDVYRAKALYALRALVDADLVVASTPVLADFLAAFHSRVTVVPNRLPAPLWRDRCERVLSASGEKGRGDRITIGYLASETHQPDLRRIEDAILAVLRSYEGRVRFLSVGLPLTDKLRSLPSASEVLPDKTTSRDYTKFPAFAAEAAIDIGVAPLVDTPFNRCKSDIKFQEYAALGIPAVYADLDPYRGRVRHGENGFLAAEESGWVECLSRLVDSTELRDRVRHAAAREILQQWETPPPLDWRQVVETASLASQTTDRALARRRMAPVIAEILSYQSTVERQLKWTVEYQVKHALGRLFRWIAPPCS